MVRQLHSRKTRPHSFKIASLVSYHNSISCDQRRMACPCPCSLSLSLSSSSSCGSVLSPSFHQPIHATASSLPLTPEESEGDDVGCSVQALQWPRPWSSAIRRKSAASLYKRLSLSLYTFSFSLSLSLSLFLSLSLSLSIVIKGNSAITCSSLIFIKHCDLSYRKNGSMSSAFPHTGYALPPRRPGQQ